MDRYRLTRNFALLALVVMALATFFLWALQQRQSDAQLSDLASRNNVALSQTVVNQLWPRYVDYIVTAARRDPAKIRGAAWTSALLADVRRLLAGTRARKIKLFDLNGYTAFSSDRSEIGDDLGNDPRFLAARAGGVVSRSQFREEMAGLGGVMRNRWVLSTFVPVRTKGSGGVAGVVEIYSDINALHDRIAATNRDLALITAAAFAAVFAVLVAIIWYADRRIRRQHHENLRMARTVARADAASQAKSTFLANMSHELRTPLNAVIGFAEMIESAVYGPVGNPRYKEYAGDIKTAGRHLLSIINDVLDLVKVEEGQVALRVEATDLALLLTEAIKLCRPDADTAGIVIEHRNLTELPTVLTDAGKLKQILVNLLANAIRYTPEGEVVVIEAAVDAREPLVRISVIDRGPGIPREDIPTALAPFGRLRPIDGNDGGLGLGLPLSRQFAELLDGSLRIEREGDLGTRITLELPLPVAATGAAVPSAKGDS